MTRAPELRARMVLFTGVVLVIAVVARVFPALDEGPALAQDLGNPKYQFQPRKGPDRNEGLKSLERSGTYVDLVGAFLNVPETPGGSESDDRFRVGFFLSRRETGVEIKVRDYDRFEKDKFHYWMTTGGMAFDAGFREFAWDASLARELRLGLGDLGAVVWVRGHGYPAVAPLLLQTTPFAKQLRAEGVRFVFVPSEAMTVECKVHPQGAPSQDVWSITDSWNKGQRSSVSWSGRDREGKVVAEGWYVLALTANYTTVQGLPGKIPLDYTFHYRPEVMVER